MNALISVCLALAVVLLPLTARAQSCAPVLAEMVNKWQAQGLKTSLTLISHQANGLSAFSGSHNPVAAAPPYEARLVWNGNWMTTANAQGVRGKMQFSDRYNTAIYPADHNNYSVDPPQMEAIEIYVASTVIFINNLKWGNWITVGSLQCANGVMWGLGDPIGNGNSGRRAVYVFSYAYTAQ